MFTALIVIEWFPVVVWSNSNKVKTLSFFPLLSYLISSLLYYPSFLLVSFCPDILFLLSSLVYFSVVHSPCSVLALCVLCLISCLLVSPCHVWCLLVSSRVFLSFIFFLISLSPVSPPSSPRSHEVMSNWVSSLLLWWFSRNILNCFGQILDQRQRAGRVDRKWLCVNLIVCSLSVLPFSLSSSVTAAAQLSVPLFVFVFF